MTQDEAPPDILKLCLIYAPEDRRLYRDLEKHLTLLERRKLAVFWNVEEIAAGSEREQVLAAQLAAADLIVYLFSGDLLVSSYYSPAGLQDVLARYRRGEVEIVPVMLRSVALDLLDPPFHKLVFLPKNRKPVIEWKNRDTALVDIVLEIKQIVENMLRPWARARETSGQSEELSATAPAAFWYVPYSQNADFTGREDLLTALHQRLYVQRDSERAHVALTGLGGSGKTQLALEYVYRSRQSYPAILWARADTAENLVSDGLLLARTLRLPESESAEQERVLAALKRWLRRQQGWLLVLDNVTDLRVVFDFLPEQHQGHVLLTTRLQDTEALASALPITPMDVGEGARLLLHRARLIPPGVSNDLAQYQQAETIVQVLEGLPLALDQAGAYIQEMGESLESYLRLYQQQRTDLLRYRGQTATGHALSVNATFSLALEQVEQLHPPAAELLRLCAFLHPALIPEDLLIVSSSGGQTASSQSIADAFELDVALRVLLMFSLIRRNSVERSLSVHRLVQVVIQDALGEQEQCSWAARVVSLVSRAWPETTDVASQWRCQAYLPHALVCADLIARWEMRSEDALHLLSEAGAYLSERASYQEAESLLLQALALSESQRGADHPDTASVLQHLGWLAHRRNQFSLANERYQRVLAIREAAFGADHLSTAQTLYTLGLLYLNLKELEQAEDLLLRALALRERHLAPEHPQVAEVLNALGMLSRARKQYEQAEALYRRALAIREQHLGPDAPATATSVSNLATLYFNQGLYSQAEPFYQRALAIRERVLGMEHPDTAAALSTLALLYEFQNRDAEAETLARRALAIQEETQDREHRETAQTLMTLAVLLFRREVYQEAEALAEEAVAIRERLLDSQDGVLVSSWSNLALIYQAEGKYTQALPLFQRALELSGRVHGLSHNSTLRIRSRLAELDRQMKIPAEEASSGRQGSDVPRPKPPLESDHEEQTP